MSRGSSFTTRSPLKEHNSTWNSYFELFYSFFNFGYGLCVIPFKFHVAEGKPVLKTSKFRKVSNSIRINVIFRDINVHMTSYYSVEI